MKIRQGFVSNSSSTSFLIYGVEMDVNEVKELIDNYSKLDLKTILYNSNNIDSKKKSDMDDRLDNSPHLDQLDIFEDILFKDMDVYVRDMYLDDDGIVYVGKSPVSMRDDQTAGEWKKEVESRLKYHGITRTIGWVEDCWRDG